jgi:mono/diheme cytochrome c family protein
MAALDFYQLALPVPRPKPGTFDSAAATRGQAAFNGKAQCSTCHVPPLFTEAGWNTHKGSEIGIDDFRWRCCGSIFQDSRFCWARS